MVKYTCSGGRVIALGYQRGKSRQLKGRVLSVSWDANLAVRLSEH